MCTDRYTIQPTVSRPQRCRRGAALVTSLRRRARYMACRRDSASRPCPAVCGQRDGSDHQVRALGTVVRGSCRRLLMICDTTLKAISYLCAQPSTCGARAIFRGPRAAIATLHLLVAPILRMLIFSSLPVDHLPPPPPKRAPRPTGANRQSQAPQFLRPFSKKLRHQLQASRSHQPRRVRTRQLLVKPLH